MPWPLAQQRAIFLSIKRRKGEAAAKAEMRKHGYGKKVKQARAKALKR